MPIPRHYAVVKKNIRGDIMFFIASFDDKQKAFDWAENANEWYGEFHPLTPLVVCDHDTLFNPPPFPVEAMRGIKG